MAPNRDSASPHQMNCVWSIGGQRHLILQARGRTRTEDSRKWGNKEDLGGHRRRQPDGSHIRFPWLRETDENSNYILLRIAIEIGNSAHGERTFSLAEAHPLSSILPLSPDAITRLQGSLLIRPSRLIKDKRYPIDYAALQQSHARMLNEKGISSQAELARHLGVSRVWVSRALKGIHPKEGKGRGSSP